MKIFIALISFLLCCSLIMTKECPAACPDNLSPVCGEAEVKGKTKSCKFTNDCELGRNGCKSNISKQSEFLNLLNLFLSPSVLIFVILFYNINYHTIFYLEWRKTACKATTASCQPNLQRRSQPLLTSAGNFPKFKKNKYKFRVNFFPSCKRIINKYIINVMRSLK